MVGKTPWIRTIRVSVRDSLIAPRVEAAVGGRQSQLRKIVAKTVCEVDVCG